MSTLTFRDRSAVEKAFGMGGGYVLGFSNRTFAEFILDAVGRDIYDGRYAAAGTSKANHLREFWRLEDDGTVATLLGAMADQGLRDGHLSEDVCGGLQHIISRLGASPAMVDAAALVPNTSEPTFALLARAVREAIDKGEPESALDRLHTFVTKYIRALAAARGIVVDKEKPLHSVFGEYVKALRAAGLIESEMAERILKSTISTLDAFNHVRNNQSLAHDNQVLRSHEALFIVKHLTSLVRLLQAIDGGATPAPGGAG